MIHKLLLFLCRSTRTSRCSYLGISPLCVDGNERSRKKGGKDKEMGERLILLGFGAAIEISWSRE